MIAAFALLLAHGGPFQEPDQEAETLSLYIASLHWDPVKSGPLLAIEPDQVQLYDKTSHDLSGFERKRVKVGGLSVIAPNWTIDLDESNLPNAYQELSEEEKFYFLLANLSPSDLSKLTGDGITAQDLSGEQKLALLSMIPEPLKVIDGVSAGNGFSSGNDAVSLPVELRTQLRLQLCKGASVSYKDAPAPGAQPTGSFSSLDSFDYGGPLGTKMIRLATVFSDVNAVKHPGKVVDSYEKKSQLSWTDARLAVPIELKKETKLLELVNSVRSKTGIEICADGRIGDLKIDASGGAVQAGDLLRGLALAVNGAYRRVGPAYVLTASLEGEGTREARLQERSNLGKKRIQSEIDRWKQVIKAKRLLDSLDFSPNDPFQAGKIAPDELAGDDGDFDKGWVQIGDMPAVLQAAVVDAAKFSFLSPFQGDDSKRPPPTEVRVTSAFGFRLLLPDGRAVESHQLTDLTQPASAGDPSNTPKFPLDAGSLQKGSAVAIRSDDSATVSDLCSQLKAYGVSEVWIESDSTQAVAAAVGSGLRVDLAIEPWRVLKGESCSDPDRNVLGLTGGQVAALKAENSERPELSSQDLADCFSPTSAGVQEHFASMPASVPPQSLNGVMLLEALQAGYWQPVGIGPVSITSGGVTFTQNDSDFDIAPDVSIMEQFGYSTALRLQFLREHQMDPIDIVGSGERQAPPSLYFDQGPFLAQYSPYPNAHFPPEVGTDHEHRQKLWRTLRSSLIKQQISGFVAKLSPMYKSLWVEWSEFPTKALRILTAGIPEKEEFGAPMPGIQLQPMSPKIAEDDQGSLSIEPDKVDLQLPVCFDMREVPVARFPAYLRCMFKKPAQ